MLTVACVYKAGGVYDDEYVYKLWLAVKAHLEIPHRFLCLSDRMPPCDWLRLEHNWPGWWSKMELFRLDPPVLYFDLDTIITGDLSDLAAKAEVTPFITLRDFYREKGIGSGLMAWTQEMWPLYSKFARDPYGYMKQYDTRGDQAFLEDNLDFKPAKWQDILPGQVCSYKVHVKGKNPQSCGVPQNCRAVCFHGNPKPRDLEWKI